MLPYDSRFDLKAHLHVFTDAMVARGIDDTHMCLLFLAMRKGATSS